VERRPAQPLPHRGRAGRGGDALPPGPRPRRGARRLAARGARTDRRPPPLPLRHGSGQRRGVDSSGGALPATTSGSPGPRRPRSPGRRSTRSFSLRATATSPSRR
jgi:hypothetical protein